MLKCKFSDVSERDMDLLFLEEFVSSPKFLNIFLSKVGLENADMIEAEQSKVDMEYGESDMTLIVEKGGNKYGILIENKIDAIAMPNQYGRYVERGKIGIKNKEYNDFFYLSLLRLNICPLMMNQEIFVPCFLRGMS